MEFQFLLNINEEHWFWDKFWNEEGATFSKEDVIRVKTDLMIQDDEVNADIVGVGGGSDIPAILVILLTAIQLFEVGDKVLKGLDGWKKLAEKTMKIRTIDSIRIDGKLATVLAVQCAREHLGCEVERIEKLGEFHIPLSDLSGSIKDGRKKGDFLSHPESYYIITLKLDSFIYVIGVKSSCETEVLKRFSDDRMILEC